MQFHQTLSNKSSFIAIIILCVEVSDCDILRHHDSRIMTYHDCENHHYCHILQTFGTNKHAVVYKYFSNTGHCTILMLWRVAALITSVVETLLNKEIYNQSTNLNDIPQS